MTTEKQPIYPVEPWNITETTFSRETNYRNETTFALSNGYIGTRGTFEEAYDFSIEEGLEGNFINGFYEREHIRYGEWNFGFPTESQSLLNLPNAKVMKVFIGEEEFHMERGAILAYERVLHMREGILQRSVTWVSESGKEVNIKITRYVSLTHKNRMAIRYEVCPVNFSGEIHIESAINGDVENHTRKTNPLVDYGPFGRRLMTKTNRGDNTRLYYEGETLHSGLTMACGCGHIVRGAVPAYEIVTGENDSCLHIRMETRQSIPVVIEKYMVYTSSIDMPKEKLSDFVAEELTNYEKQGFDVALEAHCAYMEEYWKYADVGIQGDDMLQQGIRFNLFHIMQSAGRDGRTGMGAKGLTGEGYEGHYFWDTEMYVLPVFLYSKPDLARSLLNYRYATLEQARERARVLGHEKGALYPWRTINGEEASTYYPLGTAQYHINADIAYAFAQYVKVTGDSTYLKEKAAEVLCETARVWADVGSFAESREGKYCICSVTGPDEYNAIVDNNFYTNLMARENIRDAIEALELLKKEADGSYEEVARRINLEEEELVLWQKIVDNMYFPYDKNRDIYPLDDGFMQRKPWDDSKIPPEKRHLLYENYHPLFIFRQRMSKQADAILGMYLHSHLFTKEELKRNYDFYQEVTLHHSSLSTCIFGIVACQIGYYEEAYTYFAQSARMDLDDYHENFYAGIHAANMAGTWQAIVNGFAGMRSDENGLSFHPYLPKQWEEYTFRIQYQGCVLKISIEQSVVTYELEQGETLTFFSNDEKIVLNGEGAIKHEKV